MADYQLRLVGLFMREKILSNGIETVKKDYDYILIDCPPTLGMLTVNAIAAADEIMIPVQTAGPILQKRQMILSGEELFKFSSDDLS